MEDQVVGAEGALPIFIDTTSDQPDLPFSLTALTLKKYSSPLSKPVTYAYSLEFTDNDFTSPELSKYIFLVVYSTSQPVALDTFSHLS